MRRNTCGVPEPNAQRPERKCALLAEMEPSEYRMLENGLIRCGAIFGTVYARNAEEAEALCRQEPYDPVILGCSEEAVALIRRLRRLPGRRTILVLASPETDWLELNRCLAVGADEAFGWPYSVRALTHFVYMILSVPEAPKPEDRCRRLLEEAGFGMRRKGTRYICMALLQLYKESMQPLKSVYMDIAAKEKTSPGNVESAIRAALRAAGREESNKVFLYRTAEQLKQPESGEKDRFGA